MYLKKRIAEISFNETAGAREGSRTPTVARWILSFEIPYITIDDISTFVTLRPEPNEVIFADAVACASDSISHIEDHIAKDDIDIPDNNDDFVNLLPGNDSSDGCDTYQSSFPEDI